MIILIISTKMLEIMGRNIWVFWHCYCNFVPQDPIVLDLRSRKMIDKLTWLRSKILLILWYILCWTQRPTATEEIGRRNLSTVGRNCKRAKRKLCSPPKKKVLEGIAGEKKVQGIYVIRKKVCWEELHVQKKEIVCPAPKQCICENCPCTRHTHIEPPVLYHPLNRAKRVHYVYCFC